MLVDDPHSRSTKRSLISRYNVCLVKPEGYLHAEAFVELAEVIHYALVDLGLESRLSVNQLARLGRNIVVGAHLLGVDAIRRLPESSVLVNTEQLGAREHPWSEAILDIARHFEVWDYSIENIDYLQKSGCKGARWLKLGFQPQLSRLQRAPNLDVDVLFYGSIGERRQRIIDALQSRGVSVKVLFGVYGRERDEWIGRSKIVLNCHHYDRHIFEIVRVFYLLSNRVPVVAEIGLQTKVESDLRDAVAACSYENLVDTCLSLLNDDTHREAVAERGYSIIRSRDQSSLIRSLLLS